MTIEEENRVAKEPLLHNAGNVSVGRNEYAIAEVEAFATKVLESGRVSEYETRVGAAVTFTLSCLQEIHVAFGKEGACIFSAYLTECLEDWWQTVESQVV